MFFFVFLLNEYLTLFFCDFIEKTNEEGEWVKYLNRVFSALFLKYLIK